MKQAHARLVEHEVTLETMAERLEKVAVVGSTVQRLEYEMAKRDTMFDLLALNLLDKDEIIDQLQKTCGLLEGKLKENQDDKARELAKLEETVDSLLSMNAGMREDMDAHQRTNAQQIQRLEEEKSAAISQNKAAAA